MKRKASLLLVILCASISTFGQNRAADSLMKELNSARQDTARVKLLLSIGREIQNTNLDSSFYYFKKSLTISNNALKTSQKSTRKALLSLQGQALRHIGATYSSKGNNKLALTYIFKALKIHESLNEKRRIAECYKSLGVAYCELGEYDTARNNYLNAININKELAIKREVAQGYSNIGNTYTYQGMYNKAVENYLRALKINEELRNKVGMSTCYTNLGGVYYYQKSYQKAIDYYSKSLKMDTELGDMSGVSINYNNIGLAYVDIRKYGEAINYFLKSIAICQELGELSGTMDGYNNIGLAYKELGDAKKAINYLQSSLAIAKKLNDKNGTITAQVNIADLYILEAKSSKTALRKEYLNTAVEYADEAFQQSKEAKLIQLENYASKSLMNAYKELGNKSGELKYAKLFISSNDSMFRKEKTEALAEMEAKYQNDKKQKEIEILEKDKVISHEKAQKQKILISSILGGSGLLVFFITFILRRLQITRRQKRIIEEKNILLNEKNEEISAQSEEIATQRDNLEVMNTEITLQRDKIADQHNEITASINYASRIQRAILPSQEVLGKIFPEYFVLYRPCQIVSGDFYWFKQVKNILYIVAADCTGHGIPGAFMSMLGLSLLNETISPRDVNPPHETLNELRKRLKKTLHQTGEKGEQQDGMDIALCMIDLETKMVQFSGAYNPFFLVRNNELTILKGDRMPIGVYPKDNESFTVKEIQLLPNDSFYLFSDGYVAQTSDNNLEKFKALRFKDTLLTMQDKPMAEQKDILESTFDSWKGNQDQVDDILVIGVRV